MRVFSAVTVAIAVCAAAPAFADAQSHVNAAKKAERRGEWHKALDEWKAAYSADINAEYLIGIGDAYAHIGKKDEAKKNYEAYLADPLALPANVARVKTKIAEIDRSAGALALPGGPGLALPGADAAPPPPLPGLDLPAASAAEAKGKKGKKGKGADLASLPGLDLPAPPTVVAANDKKDQGPGLTLPGLDLPAPASAKKEEKKVASAPTLDLPGLPLPGATTPPAKTETKKDQPAVATNNGTTTRTKDSTGGKVVAMITPPPSKPDHRVPDQAIATTPIRGQSEASGANRTVAYIAAGVAVVALGGGAFAYTKASSAHSDLTGKVHDGATAQSLLETEAKDKTLSFVGLAAGLVSAGIATALFAF
ncbi:MAG: hypothetical protein ABR567_09145 [Myxococcales bacterium]